MCCFKITAAILKRPALRGGGEAASTAIHTPLKAAGLPPLKAALQTTALIAAAGSIYYSSVRQQMLCLTQTAGLIPRKSPRELAIPAYAAYTRSNYFFEAAPAIAFLIRSTGIIDIAITSTMIHSIVRP